MPRPKGSKNKENTELSEARITIRLPGKLLEKIDKIALSHGQNRSEAVLEALREYAYQELKHLK